MRFIREINRFISSGIIVSLLLLSVGCNNIDITEKAKDDITVKPIIAVSIVPQKTFVEAVCGGLADIITLVPPGFSPENYEPAPQLMEKFSKASIYFSIGVPTEEANILPNAGNMKVVSLSKEVLTVYPERSFESGGRDPHIWLSPKRVKLMVEVIARTMSEFDRTNKDIYEKNAADYIAKLDELDRQIVTTLENVKNRKFIVFHPAFGYLASDYGLDMYSLEEEGKEATAKHLKDMVDFAKKENIKVIFYQEEIDSKQSKAFAEEIEGKTIQLAPLSPDYIENFNRMAKTMAEVMR